MNSDVDGDVDDDNDNENVEEDDDGDNGIDNNYIFNNDHYIQIINELRILANMTCQLQRKEKIVIVLL